uniref:Uncharacterized protein n=1 Tax=Tanacetum cinerariifolium TaxID=118510 RepID=A0A699UJK3_TANCI|nr:hypothetical protein [Tanacetum cinerariifolium]
MKPFSKSSSSCFDNSFISDGANRYGARATGVAPGIRSGIPWPCISELLNTIWLSIETLSRCYFRCRKKSRFHSHKGFELVSRHTRSRRDIFLTNPFRL